MRYVSVTETMTIPTSESKRKRSRKALERGTKSLVPTRAMLLPPAYLALKQLLHRPPDAVETHRSPRR
jgi:hypothetical protein